jgi:hypothetical protein
VIDPRLWISYGLGAALVLALAGLGAQTVRLAREQTAHADTRTGHAQQLQRLADLTARAATAAQATQQAQQRATAAIDTQRTTELDHAIDENDRLRAAVRAGTVRLRIAAACPAQRATDVPSTTAAPSVDAQAAEVVGDAARAVLDLRAAMIAERAQLLALQDYARACAGATHAP